MKKVEKILSNIFLVVLSIVFVFLICEFAAYAYLVYWADKEEFIKYASFHQLQERQLSNNPKLSFHRYLGYFPTPNYVEGKNRHNSLGYRGEEISIPKPSGEFRIVCLGGSTTYTAFVEDYRKSYPALLGEYLKGKGFKNVTVVNTGVNGWSSWESLINLELRVLDLDPDLIIIYHGVNDIHPRLVWPPEAYRGDNSGRAAPTSSQIFMPSIFEYSNLLRILMIKTGMAKSHADLEGKLGSFPDTFYFYQFRDQKLKGVYPEDIFKKISARRMLEQNKPIYFERNVRNMVAIAKIWGIEVVISSFAFSTLFTDPIASSEEYVYAYNESNRLLQEIAEDTEVHFFDFASRFPTSKDYYTDGRHVNEKGSQLKAKLFGDYLIENGLVTLPKD